MRWSRMIGVPYDVVLLTAGPDSVFALDYALKETDRPVLAVFSYAGGAGERLEKRQLETRIVPYMQRTRRRFDFFVQTLTFPNGYRPHHNVATGIAVASVIMAYGNVRRVYRGDSAEEVIHVREGLDGHGIKGDLVFDHVVASLLSAPGIEKWANGSEFPEVSLPGNKLSKIKYTAAFEGELKAMLVSCQAPLFGPNGNYQPCGQCLKCEMMKGVLYALG